METPDHSLGARIRDERVQRQWSQEDLAQKVGVRGLAVGKWERGQANPSTDNRLALARVFGIEPSELGVDAMPPTVAANFDLLLDNLQDLTTLAKLIPSIESEVRFMAADIRALCQHAGITPAASKATH